MTDALLSEVREIRKLLQIVAEPQIAQRDKKLRDELRKIVGTSQKRWRAIELMDGTRTQGQISSEASFDRSDLRKMTLKLEAVGLLAEGKTQPKLAISVPPNFLDTDAGE